jgi:predicted  nucleic acid-binding Zn-ribbon protein
VKVIKKKKAEELTPERIELQIAKAESELGELSEQMGRPEVARDAGRLIALGAEYQQAEARLRELYEEWERATTEATSA